jgi:3-mercaptopropionate dioxygenase
MNDGLHAVTQSGGWRRPTSVVLTDVGERAADSSSSESFDDEETQMPTLAVARTNAPLAQLITDLDRAVSGRESASETAQAVAVALSPYLGAHGLLTPEQRVGDPQGYRQHVVHVADDGVYSLLALVWLPGQTTPVHDHVSWCVVGVHEGEENETRFALDGDHLITTERLVNKRGSVSVALPPGDIHQVRNAGTEVAVSLHVYGADLRQVGTSIRRRYDLPVRRGS